MWYLKYHASQDIKRFLARIYVAHKSNSLLICGYYTLSAARVSLHDLPQEISKKLPHYPYIPVILLGRLAVDQNFQNYKLGRFLLVDALYRSYQSPIGAAAVIVDAKDEKACTFYQKYDFIKFPNQAQKLFIPMQKIKALFEGALSSKT